MAGGGGTGGEVGEKLQNCMAETQLDARGAVPVRNSVHQAATPYTRQTFFPFKE